MYMDGYSCHCCHAKHEHNLPNFKSKVSKELQDVQNLLSLILKISVIFLLCNIILPVAVTLILEMSMFLDLHHFLPATADS